MHVKTPNNEIKYLNQTQIEIFRTCIYWTYEKLRWKNAILEFVGYLTQVNGFLFILSNIK